MPKSSKCDASLDDLLAAVYHDLRRMAAALMRDESNRHTLQPTAIVHEAYLRLSKQSSALNNEDYFRALAATQMRRVLIDYARQRNRIKRGGGRDRVPLTELCAADSMDLDDILDLSTELEELIQVDPRSARVVELRYFGGLTQDEIATQLSVSRRTVEDDWRYARAWLYERLRLDA